MTKRLKFPTGLLDKVCKILQFERLEYEIHEEYDYPEANPMEWKGFELRPYQVKAFEKAIEYKRGMIKAATGAGKTAVIARVAGHYNLKTMIYVVSLDLLEQMRETLESSLGVEVGVIGGGECKIRQINICSVWTAGLACGEELKKAEDEVVVDKWSPKKAQRDEIRQLVKEAQVVILDEAHFAAAASIQMILKNSENAVYKYGFTATPWRTGGDDILLEAAFGRTIFEISASELIKLGYLVRPKILFKEIPELDKKIEKNWPTVKKEYVTKNDIRNQILVDTTLKLLEKGRRPLMLFREIGHGKTLRKLFPDAVKTEMVSGMLSKDERERIKRDFKRGKIDVILASTVYDQGVDIKELDALVLCSGGKSTARALQRIGRVIRIDPENGKEDALIVETYDQVHYMQKHSIQRYDIYVSEQEFKVKVGPAMSEKLSHRRK